MPRAREILLYVMPGCRRCEEARALLRAGGIDFQEINVLTAPGLARSIPIGCVPPYPILEIDGVRHASVDRRRLKAILRSG